MQFTVALTLASLAVLQTAQAAKVNWDPDAEIRETPAGFRRAFDRSYEAQGGTVVVTLTPKQLTDSKSIITACTEACKASEACIAVQPSPAAKGPGEKAPAVTGCRLFSKIDGVKAKIAETKDKNPGPPMLVYEDRAIGEDSKEDRNNPCVTFKVDYADEDSAEQILCKPKGYVAPKPAPSNLPKGFEELTGNAYHPRGGSKKIVKGTAGNVTNEWCANACAKDKTCLGFQMRPVSRNMYIENLKENVVVSGRKPDSCALYSGFSNFYVSNGYTDHVRGGRDFIIYADRAKTTCKKGQYFGYIYGDGSVSQVGCQRQKKEGESCVYSEESPYVDITNMLNGCAPGLKCAQPKDETAYKCLKV